MRTELVAISCALLLSGCTAEQGGLYSAGAAFGEANRQTMMAQVIDPDPQYEYADPETSGHHAQQAIERYRKDAVKKPEKVRTSNVATQAGGSGGN
ncbi:hypothetical protein Saro_1517 [Novosphingobium aromaticivorans DSM 12444]|uniref:Lipoprotein n=1 Tax=Novosphingobium aromaticivorans (strain ATCC 700278 / DSM 12444 / CCUG 56034 / CIP 105152 / NBRC 16084 / F199) TaxID=279238 RepID=Q2G865_NOVAD|nr:hypothetical protein [Novosphingobium aromaticivorans]ABD25958.1 hypothetical protein Saro_1517 [Novosphingobium aromaticivorans DSM 12444]SCY96882.1 hypothetical protein SAMN05660666_03969 [Novosphingobium aromaticivorans]